MLRKFPEKSILIIRLSAIGDIVMASPVAERIKRHNPSTRVTWLTQPECKQLLENNPHIDEVITWDKKRWRQLLKEKRFLTLKKEIHCFAAQLKSRNFDTAIDLQGLLKSGFLAWLSGAKNRIGLGSKEGSNWLMSRKISRNLGDNMQIGSEYRYLVNQLGIQDSPWNTQLYITKETETHALEALQQKTRGESYAVICPFTTRPQKHWVDDSWRQIILRIRGRYKLRTVILGGQGDAEHGDAIGASSGAINWSGKTSLSEAIAIIKNASLVIGVDTGLTHMAHSFRVPTVALFGSTCPYMYAGCETSKIIYLDKYCSPCRRKPTCGGKFECMGDISPDHVLTEIKPLMNIANDDTQK